MAAPHPSGAIDLEKELRCSICTDVLYQPLTLLDCLHTFCGSCLKEWFAFQAASAQRASRRITTSPYTCPSCRAGVRAARPNANVTTLLDMFLAANPAKGKTEEEKADMRKHFNPGDDVIPPIEQRSDDFDQDSEDERLMDAVRDMSVADLNPAVEANERAIRDRERRSAASRNHAGGRQRDPRRARQDMVHQSSLRSLISASGEDVEEVQEEILASILSSGMLDGIDIANMTAEQEEELTEQIAEAYRRRRREVERQARRDQARAETGTPAASTEQQIENSPPANTSLQTRSTPPRTNLIEQWTQDVSHTQQISPSPAAEIRIPSSRQASADRIATVRLNTDTARTANTSSEDHNQLPSQTSTITQPPRSSTLPVSSRSVLEQSDRSRPARTLSDDQANPGVPPYPVSEGVTRHQQTQQADHSTNIVAPNIQCNCCSKTSIQNQLHYHCNKCQGGSFNLCRSCYRAGKGCLHWFGFGYAADIRWQRNAPPGGWPANAERPHILAQRRYKKHQSAEILQEGAFCEQCSAFADDEYWHCRVCFEGAWGFCSTCLHKGRHCTHPLTPIERRNDRQRKPAHLPHLTTGNYSEALMSSGCDVCMKSIPDSEPRYHCNECNDGNYEICQSSYNQLMVTGKISEANGVHGARTCLRNHPLSIVAWRTSADGTKQRIIQSGPVGGWKASHAQRYGQRSDPISESRLRCRAYWSWFPADGVDDELSFPKFAEIVEVEKTNSDYYQGVYAGSRGLFPANHVRELA